MHLVSAAREWFSGNGRIWGLPAFGATVLALACVVASQALIAGEAKGVKSAGATTRAITQIAIPRRSLRYPDFSPLPDIDGDFLSLGAGGQWHFPRNGRAFAYADVTGNTLKQPRDCSRQAIVHYAEQAPSLFEKEKKGLLYGVRTHTSATRVGDMPGYNSCALVVYAILKQAGCKWARRTASAKAVYDMAWRRGWRPAETQEGGCLVAWNSRFAGKFPRIGRGIHADPTRKGGVYYRHLGLTTGAWMSVDNTSYDSAPSAFIVNRPIRYEAPLYLCPPEK